MDRTYHFLSVVEELGLVGVVVVEARLAEVFVVGRMDLEGLEKEVVELVGRIE